MAIARPKIPSTPPFSLRVYVFLPPVVSQIHWLLPSVVSEYTSSFLQLAGPPKYIGIYLPLRLFASSGMVRPSKYIGFYLPLSPSMRIFASSWLVHPRYMFRSALTITVFTSHFQTSYILHSFHIFILHSLHIFMVRKFYTITKTLTMVRTLDTRSENDESLRSVARDLGVDSSQLRRWKSQTTHFVELLSPSRGTRVNTEAASVHPGRQSCLHDIEEELISFIWEKLEQGLAVSVRMVLMKASQLDSEFRRKTSRAKDQAIRGFISFASYSPLMI
jgi:transposase-like protein